MIHVIRSTLANVRIEIELAVYDRELDAMQIAASLMATHQHKKIKALNNKKPTLETIVPCGSASLIKRTITVCGRRKSSATVDITVIF